MKTRIPFAFSALFLFTISALAEEARRGSDHRTGHQARKEAAAAHAQRVRVEVQGDRLHAGTSPSIVERMRTRSCSP